MWWQGSPWSGVALGKCLLLPGRCLTVLLLPRCPRYVTTVPGSYEVVYGARRLIEDPPEGIERFDAVICCGCLIKGETMHFEYICEAVTQGIMRLNVEGPCPVVFGILATLNDAQARARAGLTQGGHNHGEDWGTTALEMARISRPKPFA